MKGQFQLNNFNIRFQAKPPHLQPPTQAILPFQTRLAATMLPYRAVAAGEVIQCPTTGQPDQSKSTCSPHTTRAPGADRERAPGKSEDERGRQESRISEGS